jgi:cysteine-rich repeat protein
MTDISKAFPLRLRNGTQLVALLGLAAALASACDSEVRVYRGEATWNDAGTAGVSPIDSYIGSVSEPTRTVTVLLGAAGSGTGGAPSGGTGGTGGSPPPAAEELTSVTCGDGVIDFDTEECDDGPGNSLDLCSRDCEVADALVEQQDPEYPWQSHGRTLGEGRHPISASTHGFAVTYLEPDSDPPLVGLSVFDNTATPRERIVTSDDATPAFFANPVVAALPDGSYVVAWTDLAADGDAAGIALRQVEPDGTLGSLRTANADPEFSQYDADLLSLGDDVIVAWSDDRNADSGPDIYYRVLSQNLTGGEDQILTDSAALEGQVALAALGSSWGAAWRASTDDGRESIEVQDMGADVHWSVGPLDAGPVEDHPALIP